MPLRHFSHDQTMAPPGRSVLSVMLEADYDYWKRLRLRREDYRARKRQLATDVIARIEARHPGVSGEVEVIDVATPVTFERYTSNWQGTYEGWLITTRTMMMMLGEGMPRTLPGLERFHMAGQWVVPGGGLPTAAIEGRRVIQMICAEDGRPFEACLTTGGCGSPSRR